MSADRPEKFCPTLADLHKATGLPVGMLQAIKRGTRGLPQSPFRGRGSYPSWVKTWLLEHPGFAPEAR
jgi:hypothetical protein